MKHIIFSSLEKILDTDGSYFSNVFIYISFMLTFSSDEIFEKYHHQNKTLMNFTIQS